MAVGNKFRSIDGSNNNVGDYIVDSVTGVDSFTVSGGIGAASGYILKHGMTTIQMRVFPDKQNEKLTGKRSYILWIMRY